MKWRLRACRIQAGYTRKKAAELIGVSEIAVSQWESGRSIPTTEHGLKMSIVYKIPIEYMDFTKIGNTGGIV